jgi:hypothetical protein
MLGQGVLMEERMFDRNTTTMRRTDARGISASQRLAPGSICSSGESSGRRAKRSPRQDHMPDLIHRLAKKRASASAGGILLQQNTRGELS